MLRPGLATILLALAFCAPAPAATVTVGSDGIARFVAAPAEPNSLIIRRAEAALVFHDARADVFPTDASCTAVDVHTARCSLVDLVDVEAGDADDHVTSEVPGRFDAGPGNDRVVASGGDDQLIGGAGRDALDGAAGDDVVEGGTGYDFIGGGAGADLVDGGSGRDVVLGYTIGETLRDGADDVRGGSGRDALYGGPGADTLACGGARDLAVVSGPDLADEGDCERYRSEGVCLRALHVRRVNDRIVLRNPCDEPNKPGRSVRLRGSGSRLAVGVAERRRVVLRLTRAGRARLRRGRSVVVRLAVWPTDGPPPARAPRVVLTL